MSKYLVSLSLISLVCLLILLGVFGWLMPERQIGGYYLSLLWYLFLTFGGHLWLITTLRRNPRRFNQQYLLITVLKMFLLLIFMVIYLLIDRREVVSFVVTNMGLYITFTLFEVNALKKELKQVTDKRN